jgi:hypothetical protein
LVDLALANAEVDKGNMLKLNHQSFGDDTADAACLLL